MNFNQTLNESGYILTERAIYELTRDWKEARKQFQKGPQQFKVWLGGIQDEHGRVIDTDKAGDTAKKLINAIQISKNRNQDIGYKGDEIDKKIVNAIQIIVQGQKGRTVSKITNKNSDDIILGGNKFRQAQDKKYGF